MGAILVNAKCDRIKGASSILEYFGKNKFEYCDPFVRIFIDAKQLWETEYHDDVIGWVPIEETFHSEILNKDSRIIVRVLDRDVAHFGNSNDEMMSMTYEIRRSETGDINILTSQKFDQLFFNLHWIDEFTDNSDTTAGARCTEANITEKNSSKNSTSESLIKSLRALYKIYL